MITDILSFCFLLLMSYGLYELISWILKSYRPTAWKKYTMPPGVPDKEWNEMTRREQAQVIIKRHRQEANSRK